MNKNTKILVIALILVAAFSLGVINNEKSSSVNFQGRLPSLAGVMNLHPSASLIQNCSVMPASVAFADESLTTISFELQQKANVEVALMKDGKNTQVLPAQGQLNQGVNKLVWTNKVIKELVSGKTGEYTIRIKANAEQNSSTSESTNFCDLQLSAR